MSQSVILNKTSNFLFFLGSVFGKLKQLPFALAALTFNLVALSLNAAGYCLWIAATLFYPNQKRHKNQWYGFAEFKEQHRVSAILGLIGTVFGFVAIAFPMLLIPATWLFFSSNIVWVISELHKSKNPPFQDLEYSAKKQSNFLSYAITMTFIGFVTAFATTLMLCFPFAAIPVLITSTIINAGLGLVATEYWLKVTFHTPENKTSHEKMTNILYQDLTHQHQQQNNLDQVMTPPWQGQTCFKKPSQALTKQDTLPQESTCKKRL